MRRRDVKKIPFNQTEVYLEFTSLLLNQSEEEAIAYWNAHAELRRAYNNRAPVQRRVPFENALADFSRLYEMQLLPITTEIWHNNFKIRQWFLGESGSLGCISWLDLVKHFELAVINADDLIADSIWSKHVYDLRRWYTCIERRVEVEGAPFDARILPAQTAAIFKASFALQSDVIHTGIWEASRIVLLSHYHYVDYSTLAVNDFYNDFVFYLQNKKSLFFVNALIDHNPEFWLWFCGDDRYVNYDDVMLARHFILLLKVNVSEWHLSMWNNSKRLRDSLATLPSAVFADLLIAISHLEDPAFASHLSIVLQQNALQKGRKRKAEGDPEDEPESKRQELPQSEGRATPLQASTSQMGFFSEKRETPLIPEAIVEDPGELPLPPLPEDEFESILGIQQYNL